MSKVSIEPDFGDPYDLLGLEQSATESDINKAFRKLSLQLHPDKQSGKTERERLSIAKRFHDINQAKEFLLDPSKRNPYDVQRGSRQRRQQQDKQRESNLSERRRKMKQDLAEREARLRTTTGGQMEYQQPQQQQQSRSTADQDLLHKLRKEGKRKRDEFAKKAAEDEYKRLRKAQKKEMSGIKLRQIRLKWSRKRIAVSPSEHSIAELLSKFGTVLKVEMIGSKGNQALVTFESTSSCQPCVEFYATNHEMRATLVGDHEGEPDDEQPSAPTASHEDETVEEQRIRQAEEREKLMREMEEEENGSAGTKSTPPIAPSAKCLHHPFPLEFPVTMETVSMGPFEKLQYFERQILECLISKEHRGPSAESPVTS